MYQSVPTTERAATLQHFRYLPAFASWLLNERLEVFVDNFLHQLREKEESLPQGLLEKPMLRKPVLSKTIHRFLVHIMEHQSSEAVPSLCHSFQDIPSDVQLLLLHQGYEVAINLLPQYHNGQGLSLAIVQEGFSFCNTFINMAIRHAAMQAKAEQDRLLEQLQASERRYKEAEIIAHIGHFSYDIAQQKHTWTDELYRIFGWEPGSNQNSVQHVNEAVLHEDLPELKAAISLGIQNCHGFTVAFRIRNSQGLVRHLQVRAQIRCKEPGIPSSIFGVVQDISENAMLLQRLRQSRQLYQQAQAIAKIGNWRYDVLTGKTYWSTEASTLFGLPHTESQEADLAAIRRSMPFRYRLLIDGNINRCIRTGEKFSFESEAILSDGSRKVFFNKGIADQDEAGNITGVIGTIQDITERKAIETELRSNQRLSKKISDATPAIIWLTNNECASFSFVSSMASRILGYTSDEIMAMGPKGILQLLHPDDWEQVNQEIADTQNATPDSDGEENHITESCYRMRHKNGGWVWLQNYSIVFDRNAKTGQISQMLHISVDVTSRVTAEEQIRKKNLLLQQSNASLQEFAYIASHDLQEPLRKMATFGNMLQSLGASPDAEKAKLYTEKIVSSAKRMQNMINDLLTVSLISGNTSFRPTNLQTLLEEVMLCQDLRADKNNITIEQPAPLPEAHVIASQMQQLFQNLLSNALKFARKDVAPVIRIHWAMLSGDKAAAYGLEPDKPYLQISIADNGIGFDNAYAQRIFAMFQRLNGRSEYEGTGIGLAICRKIAEHHGGAIFASGEKNKGATFTLLLPA